MVYLYDNEVTVKTITSKITIEKLQKMAEERFGDFVKAVVDIEKKIMIVDADLHADEEQLLLENGSEQEHLWGINLYPKYASDIDFIEFDSMINLRPSFGNKTRGVDDHEIQTKIIAVVKNLVQY